MADQQEVAWREAMLSIRGFYASRRTVGGPVVIREVQQGRSTVGVYVSRVIERIGGIDVSSQSNTEGMRRYVPDTVLY